MATAPTTETGYVFSPAQNVEFKAASYWMGIMGRLGVLFSGLYAVVGLLPLATKGVNSESVGVAGVVLLIVAVGLSVAVWTIRAASAFGRVASTSGNDIGNVMVAVSNLKSLYRLQAILIGVGFGLMILGFVLGVDGGSAASR